MTSETEDLDALLRSPGWLRFSRHAEVEWHEKFADKVKSAIGDTDDAAALAKLRQVTVAKDSIERLLRWPKDRLSELQRTADAHDKETRVPLSRRGSL
jgi:hypothetical protein